MIDVHRNTEESELEYIHRICSQKESIGSWQDVADLINAELGYNYSECKYRKQYAAFRRMFDATKNNLFPPYSEEVEQRKLELQREARKFYDQRQALNRAVTVQARTETLHQCIRESVQKLNASSPLMPRVSDCSTTSSISEAILCLSDWHFGMTCENIFNTFNPEVCVQRVRSLVSQTIERLRLHRVGTLHILLMGDFCHGAIHTSARVESKELVVDQIIKVSELLSEAIAELSEVVNEVNVHATYGNHMRTVQNKKDSQHNDNMEKIIPWWLSERLRHVDKITINDAQELIFVQSCGANFVAAHGDLDSINQFGTMSNTLFSKKYGCTIDYALMGDKHHAESMEQYGIETIIVPSLCGTDSYAHGKRLYSKPAQKLLITKDGCGVDAQYNLKVGENI